MKQFTKNVGTRDRIIRAVAGIAMLVMATQTAGILQIVLGIAGIALVFTSATGFCYMYTLLGVSTCPSKEKKK